MMLFPIVRRELMVASRRHSVRWRRLGIQMACLMIILWIWVAESIGTTTAPGRVLFKIVTGIGFLASLVAGLWATSDSISREKREGTLGLLFLTDLKGYDVVFGKLAATSLSWLYDILALFPMLSIAWLFGGISAGEFWRMVPALLATLLFSLASGLAFSTICRQSHATVALTSLWLLLLIVILPGIGWMFSNAQGSHWRIFGTLLSLASPLFLFVRSGDAIYLGGPHWYWISLVAVAAVSGAMLQFACARVPRSWKEDEQVRASPTEATRAGTQRSQIRERAPLLWMAAKRRPRRSLSGWGFILLAVCLMIGVASFWRFQPMLLPGACLLSTLIAHMVVKIWIASEAARQFADDRQSGALELLLSMPVTVREIIRGQVASIRSRFAFPVILVVLVDLFACVVLVAMPVSSLAVVISFAVAVTVLFADLIALIWQGMWLGLKKQQSNRAALIAIWKILILPWVIWIFFGLMMGALGSADGSIFLYLLISLFTDLACFYGARERLDRDFRLLIADERSALAANYEEDYSLFRDPKEQTAG